jgi:hypothetical protein
MDPKSIGGILSTLRSIGKMMILILSLYCEFATRFAAFNNFNGPSERAFFMGIRRTSLVRRFIAIFAVGKENPYLHQNVFRCGKKPVITSLPTIENAECPHLGAMALQLSAGITAFSKIFQIPLDCSLEC